MPRGDRARYRANHPFRRDGGFIWGVAPRKWIRGPIAGTPAFQRRLTAKMDRARRVLRRALRAAARAGVEAEGEILEGSPGKRILELARQRNAKLVVVGSRRRPFSRSVSSTVLRSAEAPVVVAARPHLELAST
jgi:nucleotide-binding universal stress UspA family protein